jgi:hypothetical protein
LPGIAGVTLFAAAVPLFVTLTTTVISWPVETWTGSALIDETRLAAFSIVIVFVFAAADVIVLPSVTSTPCALAPAEYVPAVAALYIHVRYAFVPPFIVCDAGTGPDTNPAEPVPAEA